MNALVLSCCEEAGCLAGDGLRANEGEEREEGRE